jgi:hypothetical protein
MIKRKLQKYLRMTLKNPEKTIKQTTTQSLYNENNNDYILQR